MEESGVGICCGRSLGGHSWQRANGRACCCVSTSSRLLPHQNPAMNSATSPQIFFFFLHSAITCMSHCHLIILTTCNHSIASMTPHANRHYYSSNDLAIHPALCAAFDDTKEHHTVPLVLLFGINRELCEDIKFQFDAEGKPIQRPNVYPC